MTNKQKLETYLLLDKKKTPFLLDDMNNGKTIMLSGAWNAGKTHFWQKDIYIDYVENNKNVIRSLNFLYSFKIHEGDNEIDETIFNEINYFVASGILI